MQRRSFQKFVVAWARQNCAITFAAICLAVNFMAYRSEAQASSTLEQSASQAFRQKNLGEAQRLYKLALASGEPCATCELYLGLIASQTGQLADAEQWLDRATKKDPGSADSWYALGHVYFRQNRPKESLAALERAGHLRAPRAVDYRVGGSDYVLLKDITTAIILFERSIALDPMDQMTQYYLGRAYYMDNAFAKAIGCFTKVLEQSPHDLRAKDNLALSLAGAGDKVQAEINFREVIAWNRDMPSPALYPLVDFGNFLYDQERVEEAKTLVEPGLTFASAKSDAEKDNLRRGHLLLGRIALKQNHPAEAISHLIFVVQDAPNDSSYHFLLGRAYKAVGNKVLATHEFATAQALSNTVYNGTEVADPIVPK